MTKPGTISLENFLPIFVLVQALSHICYISSILLCHPLSRASIQLEPLNPRFKNPSNLFHVFLAYMAYTPHPKSHFIKHLYTKISSPQNWQHHTFSHPKNVNQQKKNQANPKNNSETWTRFLSTFCTSKYHVFFTPRCWWNWWFSSIDQGWSRMTHAIEGRGRGKAALRATNGEKFLGEAQVTSVTPPEN